MMEYRIYGALRQTGEEIQRTIRASTEEQARAIAANQDILVSSIGPMLGMPRGMAYPQIAGQAKWINVLAAVVGAVGIIYFIGAAVVLAAMVLASARGDVDSMPSAVAGVGGIIGLASAGIVCLGASALLRMFASIGVMIRDHVSRAA